MSAVKITMNEESTTAADIRRCLNVLYASREGTLALDRDFGLNWDCLDMPMEAAQAYFSAEVITKTAKYEPRAKISRVTYTGNNAGEFIPNVEVTINE